MTEADGVRRIAELIKDIRIAMLTTEDAQGRLVSRPMTTQDVEFEGTIWFIGERDSELARQIGSGARVNVAYAGESGWVSVSGTASLDDDTAKLREEWNKMTDAFLEGGPENPNNILIRIEGDSAEYWDSPGGRLTRVANLARAIVSGKPIEGDNEIVNL